ncbi:MAG TPA: hypothetical protein VMI72_03180 [Roseiarcus sp.]|nr:hypothetical protein [Roseiarcus sp.]
MRKFRAISLAASLFAVSPAVAVETGPPGRYGPPLPPVRPSAGAPAALPSLSDILKQVSKAPQDLIGQIKSMDWYATQPICPAAGPASACPYGFNPGDPTDSAFHQCAPAAIRFINETPAMSAIPALPDGMADGPFVLFEQARVQALQLDAYTSTIASRGFPRYLRDACASFFQDSRQLPFQVVTDFNVNFLNFINSFFHGVTGL